MIAILNEGSFISTDLRSLRTFKKLVDSTLFYTTEITDLLRINICCLNTKIIDFILLDRDLHPKA